MPRRRLPPQVLCVSVRLEPLLQGVERPNPDWIQVAAEGDYRGHHTGRPFKLDRAAFEQVVRNFRHNPAYEAGQADVVAFDFHHASELDPTSGSIPTTGVPAQAWARELEIRQGPSGLQLWALTNFLEPMLTYRRENRYRWTSVAIQPNQPDPITDENIGWYLSSVAFTNDPFIQGMQPIAASRSYAGPEDVLEALRELFEIPAMSPPDEILAALAKLRSYAANPASAPVGVDVDCLVGELRQIFNLPTLAGLDEIFAQADALLVVLSQGPPVSTIVTTRKDSTLMDHYQTACVALSAKLGRTLPEKPEAVTAFLCAAVDGAVADAGTGNAKADADLKAMLEAVGEQDVPGGMKRIADLIQQAARLKEVLPSLAAYEKSQGEAEAQSVEEDVAMAASMHFRGAEAQARPALMYMRTAPKDATPEVRAAVRAKFLETYPRPTDEQLALSRNANGSAPSAKVGIPPKTLARGANDVPILPDGTVPTAAMLAAAKGELPAQRSLALVRAHGGEKLDHYAAFELSTKIGRALSGAPPSGMPNSL